MEFWKAVVAITDEPRKIYFTKRLQKEQLRKAIYSEIFIIYSWMIRNFISLRQETLYSIDLNLLDLPQMNGYKFIKSNAMLSFYELEESRLIDQLYQLEFVFLFNQLQEYQSLKDKFKELLNKFNALSYEKAYYENAYYEIKLRDKYIISGLINRALSRTESYLSKKEFNQKLLVKMGYPSMRDIKNFERLEKLCDKLRNKKYLSISDSIKLRGLIKSSENLKKKLNTIADPIYQE